MQCDELWSNVDNKRNKQWIWLGLDVDTREIVGVYIGARDEAAAQQLWAIITARLPTVCGCIYRFLDSLCSGFSKQAPSSGRQRNWLNELH
jgi:IS1 family transposase